MPSQTTHDPRFPVKCRRCGGVLPGPVSFCPNCGAKVPLAFGFGADSGAGSQPDPSGAGAPREQAPRPPRPVPLFAAAAGGAAGLGTPPPSPGGARQWGLSRGTGLSLLAFVVLFGGFVLFREFNKPDARLQEMMSRTAIGPVMPDLGHRSPPASPGASAPGSRAKPVVPDAPAAKLSAVPPVAPSAVAPPTHTAPAHVAPVPVPRTAPSTSVAQVPVPRTAPSTSVTQALAPPLPQGPIALAPTPSAEPRAPADERRRAAPRALQAARESLQKNNLKDAKAALADVLAAQPDNSEALRLRRDVQSREQSRDASLRIAHGCERQRSWTCVWHNAGDALTIDTSSAEAKALVVRSIRESGWSVGQPGAGGGPMGAP
jgi:hypothetical protein